MELGLTAFALATVGVKYLVDIVRKLSKNPDGTSKLDGAVVNGIAFVCGYGATYVPEVGEFTSWTGRANAAIAIAGVSAIVAEAVKVLKAKQLEPLKVSEYVRLDDE